MPLESKQQELLFFLAQHKSLRWFLCRQNCHKWTGEMKQTPNTLLRHTFSPSTKMSPRPSGALGSICRGGNWKLGHLKGNQVKSSFCYSILLLIVANGKYRAYGRTIPVTDSGLRFGVQMIFVSFFCCNWNDSYKKSLNSKVIIGSIWHTLRFDLMKHVFKAKPLFRRHLECVEAIYSVSMLLHEFGWTVTSMMCCPF